ncbi:MAG: hypothetical protein ACR2IH_03540 [Pyrinomonadaceae bacterium]
MRKILAIFVALFIGVVAAAAQAPERPGIAELRVSQDDGSGNAADSFLPSAAPIRCTVQLDSAGPATVKMNLVAVNVAGVKRETRVVSTSFTTSETQSRVNFSGSPAGKWVAGKYRVDIYIGSVLAASRDFTVQKFPPPKQSTEGIIQPKQDTKPKSPQRPGGT